MEDKQLSRAAVREYAERNHRALMEFAQSGGNPHQKVLDQSDEMDLMIANWTEDERVAFLNMYAEELNALTAQTNRETEKIIALTEQKNSDAEMIGRVIGAIILTVFLIFIFVKIFSR